MDVKQIDKCIGDPTADMDNPTLKAEQAADSRGSVTSIPTLVMNNKQYRGIYRVRAYIVICLK